MPRTTLNIDGPVLAEAKEIQGREGKSLGEVVSELLAEALYRRRRGREEERPFHWSSEPMHELIELTDKDALYSALDDDDSPRGWSEVAEP